MADMSEQTILFEINFNGSKVTVRRPIKWNEINFSATWTLDFVISNDQLASSVTNSDFSNISQTPEGKIYIQFEENKSVTPYRPSFSGSRRLLMPSNHSFISPIEPSYGPARNKREGNCPIHGKRREFPPLRCVYYALLVDLVISWFIISGRHFGTFVEIPGSLRGVYSTLASDDLGLLLWVQLKAKRRIHHM